MRLNEMLSYTINDASDLHLAPMEFYRCADKWGVMIIQSVVSVLDALGRSDIS